MQGCVEIERSCGYTPWTFHPCCGKPWTLSDKMGARSLAATAVDGWFEDVSEAGPAAYVCMVSDPPSEKAPGADEEEKS